MKKVEIAGYTEATSSIHPNTAEWADFGCIGSTRGLSSEVNASSGLLPYRQSAIDGTNGGDKPTDGTVGSLTASGDTPLALSPPSLRVKANK